MLTYYFFARVQADGSVRMEPTRPPMHTGALMHRVTRRFQETLAVVVWWPERLDPATEDLLVDQYFDRLRRDLGLNVN